MTGPEYFSFEASGRPTGCDFLVTVVSLTAKGTS